MPSAEEAAGGLLGACLPVKPPGPGVCKVCCTGILAEYEVCGPCRSIGRDLGGTSSVTPISLMTPGSQLYHALRDYKSRRADVALRHRRRLAGLLGVFLERHLRCLARPSDFDALTVVPSRRDRSGPHPLTEVLRTISSLPPIQELLRPGPGAIDRGAATRDGFVPQGELRGQRVLLVDDTYASGAHLQAAAHALAQAGATVRPLVVGRMMHEEWEPSKPILAWARRRPWLPERCVRCPATSR